MSMTSLLDSINLNELHIVAIAVTGIAGLLLFFFYPGGKSDKLESPPIRVKEEQIPIIPTNNDEAVMRTPSRKPKTVITIDDQESAVKSVMREVKKGKMGSINTPIGKRSARLAKKKKTPE